MTGQGRQSKDDSYSPRAVPLALAVVLLLVLGGLLLTGSVTSP
jgi:hypothetical protein